MAQGLLTKNLLAPLVNQIFRMCYRDLLQIESNFDKLIVNYDLANISKAGSTKETAGI
jgi:lysine/ornithine N-monooxygenase